MKLDNKKSTFFIICFLLLAGLLGYFYFWFYKELKTSKERRVDERRELSIVLEWKYDLEEIERPYGDKRLIKINSQTGKKEVIINSINNKIPKELLMELFSINQVIKDSNDVINKAKLLLQKDDLKNFWEDFSLEKFSFPQKSEKLFFQLAYPTDVPFPNLISYDLNAQKFQIPKINSHYRDYFRKRFLSSDGKFLLALASLDFSQKLWLFNLEKDTIKLLVQLSGNETLDRETEGAFYIRWLDDKTVEYAVYDQYSSAINKSLIGIRKITIE